MNKFNLPFSLKKVFAGFARIYGILKLEENQIVLEFQTVDNLIEVLKSDVKNLAIPIADVEEIDFKKGILGDNLTIRVSNLNDVKNIPSQEAGEIKLSIDGKYTDQALAVVKQITSKMRAKD